MLHDAASPSPSIPSKSRKTHRSRHGAAMLTTSSTCSRKRPARCCLCSAPTSGGSRPPAPAARRSACSSCSSTRRRRSSASLDAKPGTLSPRCCRQAASHGSAAAKPSSSRKRPAISACIVAVLLAPLPPTTAERAAGHSLSCMLSCHAAIHQGMSCSRVGGLYALLRAWQIAGDASCCCCCCCWHRRQLRQARFGGKALCCVFQACTTSKYCYNVCVHCWHAMFETM